MNDLFSATAYALVSQFFDYLASLPGYSEEDNPWVAKYEAYGGECAPPGALTLRQHDLVHFLLGVNFKSFYLMSFRAIMTTVFSSAMECE